MLPITNKTVFVLGAGFTKAFFPKAPLLIDDYNAPFLKEKFCHFNYATRILDNEIKKRNDGKIDFESLLTRVENKMPYDNYSQCLELQLLATELKSIFKNKIVSAQTIEQETSPQLMDKFAKFCVDIGLNCITFNYDGLFDQKLWEVKKVVHTPQPPYWHPDGGYGFFCKSSGVTVDDALAFMDETSMLLLKLHGSLNWRVRRGKNAPFTTDAILHHENWITEDGSKTTPPLTNTGIVEMHLESEPFIVPPLLTKQEISKQPVLQIIWALAFEKLATADQIIFIGYSLPITDLATRYLFSEAINDNASIVVVNLKDNEPLRESYKTVFPKENIDFQFKGALTWLEQLLETHQKAGITQTILPTPAA